MLIPTQMFLKDVGNVPTRYQSILFKLENILQELTVESETWGGGKGSGSMLPREILKFGPLERLKMH